MKALITGASSGLGADFARILHKKGYELILVARRADRLEKLKNELKDRVKIIPFDISGKENAKSLYETVKGENIDLLINNAGFGLFGEFDKSDLARELEMIDLNIKSVHTLTKLFLKDFIKKDSGYILNVASSAGLMPAGPLMSTYYATKAYVVSLTLAISEEIKNSNVYISALCPGPFDTEFNDVAGVDFRLKGLKSYDVASYALKKMFKKKSLIIPGTLMKLANFAKRALPTSLLLKAAYHIQNKKR